MKIKTLVPFAGVPKETTGIAERDPKFHNNWKVTWDLERSRPLIDWFDQSEFDEYLEEI